MWGYSLCPQLAYTHDISSGQSHPIVAFEIKRGTNARDALFPYCYRDLLSLVIFSLSWRKWTINEQKSLQQIVDIIRRKKYNVIVNAIAALKEILGRIVVSEAFCRRMSQAVTRD